MSRDTLDLLKLGPGIGAAAGSIASLLHAKKLGKLGKLRHLFRKGARGKAGRRAARRTLDDAVFGAGVGWLPEISYTGATAFKRRKRRIARGEDRVKVSQVIGLGTVRKRRLLNMYSISH